MDANLFLLENRTCPNSNIAYFWRTGGCGYTANIDEAQRFTSAEADSHIQSAQGSHLFIKHRLEDIESKAFRVVNIDSLRTTCASKQ